MSTEASCCKLFASEMCGRVADLAVQIFGGAGYISDYGIVRRALPGRWRHRHAGAHRRPEAAGSLGLSDEVNRILRLPDITARIEALGLPVAGGKREEVQKIVRSDAAVYAKIIKDANIKLSQ